MAGAQRTTTRDPGASLFHCAARSAARVRRPDRRAPVTRAGPSTLCAGIGASRMGLRVVEGQREGDPRRRRPTPCASPAAATRDQRGCIAVRGQAAPRGGAAGLLTLPPRGQRRLPLHSPPAPPQCRSPQQLRAIGYRTPAARTALRGSIALRALRRWNASIANAGWPPATREIRHRINDICAAHQTPPQDEAGER